MAVVPANDAKLDHGESEGTTEFDPPEIYVSDALRLSAFMETLYHEITHAVDFVCGIEDGAIEEDIADKHAKIWSQLWINNPRFQRWWAKACVAVRRERSGRRK